MAKKTTTSKSSKVKVEMESQIIPSTSLECYKAMGEVCTHLGKDGIAILDQIDAYHASSLEVYKQYTAQKREADIAQHCIDSTSAQKKAEIARLQKQLDTAENNAAQYRQKLVDGEEKMVQTVLGMNNGWQVLAAAEKQGVKVNWQQTPFGVINTPECMAFLAQKNYNFEAKQVHFKKEMDFVEYNNNVVAFYEQKTVEAYNYLTDVIKERNGLIRSAKAQQEELNNPKTTAQRKKEIQETAKKEDQRFQQINKALPQLCEIVNVNMLKYFDTATLLKEVADKKYVSPERIKAIQLDTLEESLANMRGRYQIMKRVNAQFNPQAGIENQTDRTLATVIELESNNGLQSALANAGNKEPIRQGTDMDLIDAELNGNSIYSQNQNALTSQQKFVENSEGTQQHILRNASMANG